MLCKAAGELRRTPVGPPCTFLCHGSQAGLFSCAVMQHLLTLSAPSAELLVEHTHKVVDPACRRAWLFLWHCCFTGAALPLLEATLGPRHFGKASVLSICEHLSQQAPQEDQQVRRVLQHLEP